MNNQPIGILDSGVGGLTVWREIVKKLPHESTVYIADSAHIPYGSKSGDQIYELASKMINFLVQKDVKLIIIACNTITVTNLDKLRKSYPKLPIIGTVPVVKTASEKTKNGKIGILSTTSTANSEYQKDLIKRFASGLTVVSIGTDELVPIVEESFDFTKYQTVPGFAQDKGKLKQILQPFVEAKVDVLALGCTHFPFLREEIQNILGSDVSILDSGEAISRQVERILAANKTLSSKQPSFHDFYTTASYNFPSIALELIEDTLGKKKIRTVKNVLL